MVFVAIILLAGFSLGDLPLRGGGAIKSLLIAF